MKGKIITRIILAIALFFITLNGWWYISLPLIILGTWFYPYYLEGIAAGIFFDLLFNIAPSMGLREFIGTIATVVVFGVIGVLKKVVRK